MQDFLRFFKFVLVGFVFIMLHTSCLDQEIITNQEEAQQKLDDFIKANGYTDEDKIAYGVYVKTIEAGTGDMPTVGNTVLLNYTGMYTDNSVFETTDINESAGLSYEEYYIYGPKRHTVGTLIVGFDTAIRTLNEGALAQFVIPAEYAFGNYEPVVYDVELLEVIEDDTIYETNLFDEFVVANGFSYADTITTGMLYKLAEGDELNFDSDVTLGDTIHMRLTARYAEVYEDGLGRVFYPRPNNEDESSYIEYWYGSTSAYPIRPAIDSAIKYMVEGQTMEIAFKSGADAESGYKWGYTSVGKLDSDLNFYIVSPFTPLHYTIEFVENKGQ